VVAVVVAGRLCKTSGEHTEDVAYPMKELQLRVRTGVIASDASLNERVVLQVSFFPRAVYVCPCLTRRRSDIITSH